ncbi:hypothetical protein THAOC_07659 [Thalassiosira oceanica]|uniref:Uncharacterized protein n=1 Tax=Thalassiosira oceanica TaxID=159749 RepID=K0TBV9_THAOC|nr:hypothetical protein THAOC_07659 [Thalassiosira oceanica]|eukprot:EJK70941.1 hypothetical protein THAOC_07659 [Thalassiosira oceanica]
MVSANALIVLLRSIGGGDGAGEEGGDDGPAAVPEAPVRVGTAFDLLFVYFGASLQIWQSGGGGGGWRRPGDASEGVAGKTARVTLDVGREEGTMLEGDWASSSARLLLPASLAFARCLVETYFPGGEEYSRTRRAGGLLALVAVVSTTRCCHRQARDPEERPRPLVRWESMESESPRPPGVAPARHDVRQVNATSYPNTASLPQGQTVSTLFYKDRRPRHSSTGTASPRGELLPSRRVRGHAPVPSNRSRGRREDDVCHPTPAGTTTNGAGEDRGLAPSSWGGGGWVTVTWT